MYPTPGSFSVLPTVSNRNQNLPSRRFTRVGQLDNSRMSSGNGNINLKKNAELPTARSVNASSLSSVNNSSLDSGHLKTSSQSPQSGHAHQNQIASNDPNLQIKLVMPWRRHSFVNNSKNNEMLIPPPNSSAISSHSTSGNARILSSNEFNPNYLIMMPLVVLTLFFLFCSFLVLGSYQDWPIYASMPLQIKYQTDKFIIKSPLPNSPLILTRLMLANMKDWKTVNHQLTIDVVHSLTKQKSNAIFTFNTDLKDDFKTYLSSSITWPYENTNNQHSLAGDAWYDRGVMVIRLNEADNANGFFGQALLDQPFKLILNPSQNNSDIVGNRSAGEFALTKIRNQNLKKLVQNYSQIIINKSILANDDLDKASSNYRLYSQLSDSEVLNFIKEFMSIYRSSKATPPFSQSALDNFYDQTEKILGTLNINIYIDKETLELKKLEWQTKLHTELLNGFQTADALNLGKMTDSLTLSGVYEINGLNKDLVTPPSPNPEDLEKPNWKQVVTDPLFGPLLDKNYVHIPDMK